MHNFVRSIYLVYLNEQYSNIAEDDGPAFFSAQYLQDKLMSTFINEIKIISVSNRKILAPIDSSIVDLNAVYKMKNKQSLYEAAMKIRSDILVLQKKGISKSVSTEDLLNGEINDSLPDSLLYFL